MTGQWLRGLNPKWEVRRPKTIFQERRAPSTSSDIHLTPSQHYGVIPQEEYMALTGSKVVLNLVGADNMKHVEPDDFVIHLRSFQGGIERSRLRGKVSNAYTVFSPIDDEADPRFFRWVLKSGGFIQELQSTTNQLRDGQSIKFGDFASIQIPFPPLAEQRRIADFLDDQVTRIDQAIQLRKRQIKLVDDLEQSAIEDSFRSDSREVQLRRLGTSVTTGPFGTVFAASDYVSGGIPMINPTHIVNGQLSPDPGHSVSQATAARLIRHHLRRGDIVTGRKGDLGRSALVKRDQDGWICGSDAIAIHADRSKLLPEFLEARLHSVKVRSELVSKSPGATMPSLNEGMLLSVTVPSVPISHQQTVVDLCDQIRSRMSDMRSLLQSAVGIMEERKRSLITSAVTGEFDVTSASVRASEVATRS